MWLIIAVFVTTMKTEVFARLFLVEAKQGRRGLVLGAINSCYLFHITFQSTEVNNLVVLVWHQYPGMHTVFSSAAFRQTSIFQSQRDV